MINFFISATIFKLFFCIVCFSRKSKLPNVVLNYLSAGFLFKKTPLEIHFGPSKVVKQIEVAYCPHSSAIFFSIPHLLNVFRVWFLTTSSKRLAKPH
jgi:hypothetical protein